MRDFLPWKPVQPHKVPELLDAVGLKYYLFAFNSEKIQELIINTENVKEICLEIPHVFAAYFTSAAVTVREILIKPFGAVRAFNQKTTSKY